MTRFQRTQKFNNLIEDEFFLRLYNLVRKNNRNKKIIFQYKNFYNNLSRIDMFLDLNSNFVFDIDWDRIKRNEDLNIGFILKYSQYIFSGNLNILMNNKNFNLEWLLEFPNADWDYYFILSEHKNFMIEWVEKFPDKDWDFEFTISKRKNFNISWVEKFPYKDWDFEDLSLHKKFKIEWVEKFPDKDWDFEDLSLHKKFKIEWVEKFPDKDWNFKSLSLHKKFKIEWVEKFPDKYWNFYNLSSHKNFKIEWLEKFPDKDWNLEDLSLYKKKFKFKWVEKYPDKDCDSKLISLRKYIYNYKYICGITGNETIQISHHFAHLRTATFKQAKKIKKLELEKLSKEELYAKYSKTNIDEILNDLETVVIKNFPKKTGLLIQNIPYRTVKLEKTIKDFNLNEFTLEDFCKTQEEKKFVVKGNNPINNKDFIKISDKRWKKHRKKMLFY